MHKKISRGKALPACRNTLQQFVSGLCLAACIQIAYAEEASERHVISQATMECLNSSGYPAEAAKAEATGVTVMRVHVNEEGVVTDTEIVKSSGVTRAHKFLDRATVDKVKCPGVFKKTGEPYVHELEYVWKLK
ncbi:MAG TPA: TonB family protein [Ideonella sp.]|uniref:energy transducer TonB n=1 Tax=Ideonella sp. TaxID=1929293 RepID=UPI002B7DB112|nr:TonB family protein [Ideonella sp.]HSI47522.1 TonB family protein [Ideonella sp.]